MIDTILELAKTSPYDFRETACPIDPYRHLFDEWAPYYRMKWAVARILQPRRVLEIGVRYGYSALAFLNASPGTSYVGIDIDSDSFGGVKGAIHWARAATRAYKAEFVIADSQDFAELPGGPYDLVHVDGQQNQEGYLHDLELAVRGGRFVLVDGFFWTRSNFLAASEFLFRERAQFEFSAILPGYAGELLIKTKPPVGPQRAQSSGEIRSAYTTDYYLFDCGGYEAFKRTGGAGLEDSRLRAVSDIAGIAHHGRALDLGCGRGEISIALARQGFAVTGIDYSPEAIALAQHALSATGDRTLDVSFQCADVNRASLAGIYDAVTAADVVEHLSVDELDALYDTVARHLSREGIFAVHTYPNAWLYRFEHARRLRVARSVGAYLPSEPRTAYEKLMHINEQSPCVLRRQLSRHFPHVVLWFANHDLADPGDHLNRKFRISELRAAGDLFAVASHAPIDRSALAAELRMQDACPLGVDDIAISIVSAPTEADLGMRFPVDMTVFNRSHYDLKSWPPFPVHLCYHWVHADSGEYVVFDGERTSLSPPLRTASTGRYRMFAQAPRQSGKYTLRVTLVQEQRRWFDVAPTNAFCDAEILVRPAATEMV